MHEMSEISSTSKQEGFLGCEEDKEGEIESKTMMKVTQSVISPSMELLSTHMGTQMVGFRKCCQADECGSDLSDAKRYYKRHKVCERHAKAPVVLVKQIRQRFCQQCSKFHEISKFDYTKRSCRDRLADHNERRRKSQIDPKNKEVKDNMRIRELVVKKHLKHFLNLNEVSVQMSPSSSTGIDAIASSSFNAGGLSHPNGGPNLGEMRLATEPPPDYHAFSNVMSMMAAHQARNFF